MEEHSLLIIRDKHIGTQWERPLSEDHLGIGREKSCGLTLLDRQVSRQHATIFCRGGLYWIRDNGSRNGTLLNDKPVQVPQPLQDGDKIQVAARYQIIFVASESTAPMHRLGITSKGIRLDRLTRRVWVDGVEIRPELSAAQYRLLKLLYDRQGSICSREDLIEAVWEDDAAYGISDQAIDAILMRLRRRLRDSGAKHSYIETVRGQGFCLNMQDTQ